MTDAKGFQDLKPETEIIVQALDLMEQGIAIFNDEKRLCLHNSSFKELFTYGENDLAPETPLDEILQHNWSSSQCHESPAPTPAQFLTSFEENSVSETTRHLANGKILHIVLKALGDANCALIYEDISSAQRALKRAKQHEEQFRHYLDLSPVGAVMAESDGSIYYVNQRFLEIFGYQNDNPALLNVNSFYAKPDERIELLSSLQNKPSPSTFRFLGKKSDGSFFPMLVTSQFVNIEGRERIFSWVIDMTDLSEAEKTIKSLNEQNQLILSAASAGILGLDHHNIIQFINPAAAQKLGYKTDELQNRSIFNLIADDDFFPQDDLDAPYLSQGQLIMKSGKKLDVKLTVTQVDKHNGLTEKVVVFDDISDRLAAEKTMRQAMEDIEATSQAKSHFLSTMSHELRTPLNAILGFTQILKSNNTKNLNEQQLTFIQHIFKAGDHLLKIINEAIDIASIESGKISLSLQSIEVDEIIYSSVHACRERANEEGITVLIEQPDEPHSMVVADYARLQQVLSHLIINAIKYNRPQGKVTIGASALHDNCIRIYIEDTGYGIPTSAKDDIFTPFNRLNMNSEQVEGTGLGLTIARKLTLLMDGQIGYKTQQDKGTRFWVELPRAGENDPLLKTI